MLPHSWSYVEDDKLSSKVSVAQVLKLHKSVLKLEQVRLSSSISSKVIYGKLQAEWRVFYGLDGTVKKKIYFKNII